MPGEKLCRLYETWGAGGLGLIITGNVMVDGDELGEPNNVVLENDDDLDKFRAWTSAAKKNGAQIWAQINHPGRQAPSAISRVTVAPSAIKLKVGNLAFREPHALSDFEIRGIIKKFARTSQCKQAGFDGVQIHGAHGYLVSQFLRRSPTCVATNGVVRSKTACVFHLRLCVLCALRWVRTFRSVSR